MLGLHYIRAVITVGLLGSLLTACTQAIYLPLPRPDESEVVTAPAPTPSAEDAAARLASRPRPAPPAAPEVPVDPDLWRSIGAALTLELPPRQRGGDPLKHFGHSRRYLATATARAAPYLAHVWQEIQVRKLPAEIALIPLLESSYNNSAGSARGPAGLWQFIPATGSRFGLRQSTAYDGRKDVVASTRAALDYFAQLGQRFDGDWLLAFAAYNCGERTVEQAIARNRKRARPTDFWSLDLPSGTRHYIPRLLDLAAILKRPADYGVTVARISSEPYFEAVDLGGGVALQRIARKSGLYPNDFETLNAAYRQRATIPGGPTSVLVRHGFGGGVRDLLASLPPAERRVPRQHVVVAGDTLSTIAARHHVSVAELTRGNRLTSQRLRIGQTLLLPHHAVAAAPGTDSAGAARTVAATPSGGVHVVQNGDNLWDVARRYGLSSRALAQANGIGLGSTLRLGQRLRIPGGQADTNADTSRTAQAEIKHYKVRSGDSLWTIARRFKVSISKLTQWNGREATRLLQPGERLIVQQPAAPDSKQKI